jgi:hypothetical protein
VKRTRFLCSLAVLCTIPFLPSCKKSEEAGTGGKKLTIALLPKSKGNQYFVACEKVPVPRPRTWGPNCFSMAPPTPIRRSRTRSWKTGSPSAWM